MKLQEGGVASAPPAPPPAPVLSSAALRADLILASGQGGLDGVTQAAASLETAVLPVVLASSFSTQAFLRIHSSS